MVHGSNIISSKQKRRDRELERKLLHTVERSKLTLLPVSRAGLLSTPVHRADSPVGSGQPQHRPSRQTLRGVRGSQQRGVEQVPEGLQGGPRNIRDYLNAALSAPLQVIDRGYPALHCA